MQSNMLRRAAVQGLRTPHSAPLMKRGVATLATFKTPKVANEPNHHYVKDGQQRAGLTAAIEDFRKRVPLDVPVVVGGKEVRDPRS
jgi:1-pyrroline-5-carboxylate dehydrogenase